MFVYYGKNCISRPKSLIIDAPYFDVTSLHCLKRFSWILGVWVEEGEESVVEEIIEV